MNETAILAVLTAAISGVGWMGLRVYEALKECARDRLSLTGSVGKLTMQVADCFDDRVDLRKTVDVLHEKIERVNLHLLATDTRVQTNAESMKRIDDGKK